MKGDNNFWQPLFEIGAKLFRHDREKQSGQEILDFIVAKSGSKIALDIQVEMVDQGKELAGTGAGQEVQAELDKIKKEHKKEIQEYKKEMDKAIREQDAET